MAERSVPYYGTPYPPKLAICDIHSNGSNLPSNGSNLPSNLHSNFVVRISVPSGSYAYVICTRARTRACESVICICICTRARTRACESRELVNYGSWTWQRILQLWES